MVDKTRFGACLLVALLCVAGCTGRAYQISSLEVDPSRYEVVGEGEATATGILLLGFIPIRLNDKTERAAEELKREFGGELLTDVSVTEKWWWGYVLTGHQVRVKATVLKKSQ